MYYLLMMLLLVVGVVGFGAYMLIRAAVRHGVKSAIDERKR